MPNLLENPADMRLNNDRFEMQQMLGNPPSWTLRYGIAVVFSGVLIVFGLAYFIRYPDIIECPAILVTENPPIRVVAKIGGSIHKLLVINQHNVKEKQVLAIIANTANYADVETLAQKLRSDLCTWLDTYVITASIAGQLVMNKIWTTNQNVSNNEEIFIILPKNTSKTIVAKAKLPSNNSGKVKLGQIAELRLTDYPFQEYGSLKARVSELSPIAIDNKKETEKEYAVQLQLTDTVSRTSVREMHTTAHKTLIFKQEMAATARIVTEDRRVTARIFEQFMNLLK